MKILIGSKNNGKISEFKAILGDQFTVVDLNQYPNLLAPAENGLDLKENAIIKAKYYHQLTNLATIADDTGLFIPCLNGEPGVNSARYSGGDDHSNRQLVLSKLEGKFPVDAYFQTVMVYTDGLQELVTTGYLYGQIINCPIGENGFGYDSIFYLPKYQKTLAQLSDHQKNEISHRKQALSMMKELIVTRNIESEIIDCLSSYYPQSKIEIIDRFGAGMSNYTYKVKVDQTLKVIRIPGENADLFVNRENEKKNLLIASTVFNQLKPEIFDLSTGIKITDYIDGKVLESSDLNDQVISLAVDSLKQLHQLGPISANANDPFKRLSDYELLVVDDNWKYQAIKAKFYQDYYQILINRPLTFCHGDSHLSNLIKIKDQQVIYVDYEFSGNNDYLYDIACFCNDGFDVALKILTKYHQELNSEQLDEKIKIVKLWFIYQSLQWFNVAMIKEQMGMSQKLQLDFKMIANWFLDQAQEYLTSLNNDNN